MKAAHDRRTFLRISAAGIAAFCNASARANSVAVPSMVIDTHTHFYDPTRPEGVPWPPKNDPLLYRRVLPADYRALPKPQPVNGTVVVEASPWVEDNQWILDLAGTDPFIFGLVGNLQVGADDFRSNLRRFAKNPLFRGLRIGSGTVRQCLANEQRLDDLRLVANNDLALDLLIGPDVLPDVARLAKAIPGLRMIIDHVANVRIDGKAVDGAWSDGMQAAGQHQNVYCKVSGLVEGSGRSNGDAPPELDFYRPVLDQIWTAFGVDRLVYGSNWPVSERFASCHTVQQIVLDFFRGKNQEALDAVFWRNSRALYKWAERKVNDLDRRP
jgi:L-fuconolactonase